MFADAHLAVHLALGSRNTWFPPLVSTGYSVSHKQTWRAARQVAVGDDTSCFTRYLYTMYNFWLN